MRQIDPFPILEDGNGIHPSNSGLQVKKKAKKPPKPKKPKKSMPKMPKRIIVIIVNE